MYFTYLSLRYSVISHILLAPLELFQVFNFQALDFLLFNSFYLLLLLIFCSLIDLILSYNFFNAVSYNLY